MCGTLGSVSLNRTVSPSCKGTCHNSHSHMKSQKQGRCDLWAHLGRGGQRVEGLSTCHRVLPAGGQAHGPPSASPCRLTVSYRHRS